MFPSLTTNTNRNTTRNTNRKNSSRRRSITTAAALVSLALAASACGGSAPADSTDIAAARLDLTAEAAPVIDDAVAAIADLGQSPAADPAGQAATNPAPDEQTGQSDINSPTEQPAGEAPTEEQPPSTEVPDSGDEQGDPDVEPHVPTPQQPEPQPAVDLRTLYVWAPELNVAQACYANSQTLTWTAGGVNEMVLDFRVEDLVQRSTSEAARSPLSTLRDDNGGPLLNDGITAEIDQNRGFFLGWKINGRIGDVDVRWESNTAGTGGHSSEVFRSPSNALCFVTVGFHVSVADAPPSGPNRPELSDAVNQPSEAKLAEVPQPQSDMEVAVRNVKIEATPECFAGGLSSRFFDTLQEPVAVVLDTNGITETLATTMAHDRTELTDELRELSISDGALRAFANRNEGYAVTVQVHGAVSGGIVVEWAQTATAPGTYTSPVFSGPTDDCDISINFLVLELD